MGISAQAQEWELVWSDEFSVPGLPDPDKWGYEKGLLRNDELQYYTVGRSENARIEDTILIIEARKENYENAGYTSASLTSRYKGDWKYGRFEVRAQIPTGKGTWPALWLMPTYAEYGGWPRSGEIDIMENVGRKPNAIHQTVHIEGTDGSGHQGVGGSVDLADAYTRFYTYSIEWNEDSITWFIDDEQVYEYKRKTDADTRTWPFDKKFYMILNLAIGGSWGGQDGVDDTLFPHKLYIDYVRVYQRPAEAGPFTITIEPAEGGSVELSPLKDSYEKDESVQITAIPEAGYLFDRFIDMGSTNPFTFSITENTEITPVFEKIQSEGELLYNGNFDKGTEGWDNLYIYDKDTQEAEVQVENGEFSIEILKPGSSYWQIGFQQLGIGILKDTSYRISFDAWADQAGDLGIQFAKSYGDYSSYFDKSDISISTEKERHSVEFEVSEQSDANCRLYFAVGNMAAGKVYFDNISMTKASFITGKERALFAPHFTVYPNPVKDQILGRFEIREADRVVIELYDLNGKLISTLMNDQLPAGTHDFSYHLDSGNTPPGVYILTIQTREFRESKRLICYAFTKSLY